MTARVLVKMVKRPDQETLKGIITIYRQYNWLKPSDTPARLRRLIAGSHCFAVALSGGRVIGIGRAISDGVSDAYIQDMAVLKERRGDGAGSALLKALLRRLRRDGVNWVGLIAQDNSEYFYGKLGFRTLKNAAPMLSRTSYV